MARANWTELGPEQKCVLEIIEESDSSYEKCRYLEDSESNRKDLGSRQISWYIRSLADELGVAQESWETAYTSGTSWNIEQMKHDLSENMAECEFSYSDEIVSETNFED